MSKSKKTKGPKMAIPRPEEIEYLKRWEGARSAPSIWEKMDRDPVYERQTKLRNDLSSSPGSMSNSWGVGRPKGPKGS
jgi:hypothetical protein